MDRSHQHYITNNRSAPILPVLTTIESTHYNPGSLSQHLAVFSHL